MFKNEKKGEKFYMINQQYLTLGEAVDPKYENEIEYSRNWH